MRRDGPPLYAIARTLGIQLWGVRDFRYANLLDMAATTELVRRYEQFSIEITKNYSVSDWHDEACSLEEVVNASGLADKSSSSSNSISDL